METLSFAIELQIGTFYAKLPASGDLVLVVKDGNVQSALWSKYSFEFDFCFLYRRHNAYSVAS
jgi:hypothetical protein